MTSPWLFTTSINPCYDSLTEDQIRHLHFLDLCASRWVVNEPTRWLTVDLGLPFTLIPCVSLSLMGSCRMIFSMPMWLSTTCSASHTYTPRCLSCFFTLPPILVSLWLPVAVGRVARLCHLSFDPGSPSVLNRSLCLCIVGSDDTCNYSPFH